MEIRVIQIEEVIIKEVDLIEKIKKSKAKDNKVIKAIEEIKQTGLKVLRNKE